MNQRVTRASIVSLVVVCGCSPTKPKSPPRRSEPPPAVHVLREIVSLKQHVDLLSVDRLRRQIHLAIRPHRTSPGGAAWTLETITLSSGRVAARWQLPNLAGRYFKSPAHWMKDSGTRPPWFARLVELERRGGRRYVSSRPPVMAMGPSGKRVAFNYLVDYLAVGPVRGGTPRLLNYGSPACYRPAFSPDGRWLAYSCFVRRVREYCPTLVALGSKGGQAPVRFCKLRGYSTTTPYWRPDSSAFYSLSTRGFGAYIDPVKKVCLVRVEVKTRRETPLWCRTLDGKRDRHSRFLFRMDPSGKAGVVIISPQGAPRCSNELRWIRMSDGKLLATLKNVPTPYYLGHSTVLSADGRLLTRGCDKGLLLVDLRRGRVRHLLPSFNIAQVDWDGKNHLVLLRNVSRRRKQLIEVDLRRLLSSLPVFGCGRSAPNRG